MKLAKLRCPYPYRNKGLCFVLCFVFVAYTIVQLVYAMSLLSSKGLAVRVFRTEPLLPPYVAFLASVLASRSTEMNATCMWHVLMDRDALRDVEVKIKIRPVYEELRALVETKLKLCAVIRTSTESRAVKRSTLIQASQKDENLAELEHPACFRQPNELKFGPKIDVIHLPPTLKEIDEEFTSLLEMGGHYPGPSYCRSPRHSTVVIIPYRNRELHLRYWLHYMIENLMQQQLRFRVIVVEQDDDGVFNKGQLMNTGFKWAISNTSHEWDCFVFHDVDMISEVYGTLYKCGAKRTVVHLAPYVDKFNYTTRPKVGVTVGGAVGFRETQYKAVNGYSNVYWGWGGEDDDMNVRIRLSGLKRWRPKQPFGRYKMVRHKRDSGNPTNLIRHKLLKTARSRMMLDGLSNLATVITRIELHATHTKLHVKINRNTRPPPGYTMPSK